MSTLTAPQMFELALQQHRAGRLESAEALYRQVLAIRPEHPDSLHLLGVIAHQTGHHEKAVEHIRRAIAIDPANPGAHSNLGEACRALGRLDEAAASYRRALELKPDLAEAHHNLANVHLLRNELDEAVAGFQRALHFRPNFSDAFKDLGLAYMKMGRPDKALEANQSALALSPSDPDVYSNMGVLLTHAGHLPEAIAAIHQALEIRPTSAEAHYNLGYALSESGDFDAAISALDHALSLKPGLAAATFGKAVVQLLRGDFASGWPLYESRWETFAFACRSFPQPRWDGTPLDGQRLLVYTEQGLGDAIQFIRYAPLIAARGGEVLVECPPSLVDLLRTAKGVPLVIASGDPLPPFDLHIPMLSQPLAFHTTRETIPAEVPYLFADAERRRHWRERLGHDRSRFRVGLAWAGNPENCHSRKRDIPLERMTPLLRVPGVEFFSLQLGASAPAMTDCTADLKDFADTAALIAELDLVISVDTAVAHLAGALGLPVWTLLPFVPDWRWGMTGETTSWYPTMRLFRQPSHEDWDSVIAQAAQELAQRTSHPFTPATDAR